MLKRTKILLSIILVICLTASMVLAMPMASVLDLQSDTVAYYQNNKRDISSFWEVGALYGAGVDLNDPIWNFDELNTDEPNLPTDYANHILAALALGNNPRTVLNRDIVAELAQKQNSSGAFSSMVNQHIWAMIALDGVNAQYNKTKAVQYLSSLKKPDGGFNLDSELDVSDADITGMALIALSNNKGVGNADSIIEDCISFLKGIQLENAGFECEGRENPNTIATVISGLCAVGENVLTGDWVKGENLTMADALAKFRLDDDSYSLTLGENETNLLVTAQALIALSDIINEKSVWTGFDVSYPAPEPVTVNVRIEGIYSNVLNKDITVTKFNAKALDAIEKALTDNSVEHSIINGIYGKYISSIKGESASTFEGYDGWLFAVNGELAPVGVDSYEIEDGDEIIIYYGDYSGTLIPSYTISPSELRAEKEFFITVSSEYFDWELEETVFKYIEGASVEIGNKTYLTNASGIATINDISTAGTYTVKISKNQENNYPAILRTAPFEITVLEKIQKTSSTGGGTTTKITLPAETPDEDSVETVATPILQETYKDISDISDWAKENVEKAKELNIMTGNQNGEFEPLRSITRAEFTAILLRLMNTELSYEPSSFNDVSADHWSFSYIVTASNLGFINGFDDNTFRPEDDITREEIAVIISRAFTLEEGTSTSSFSDDDQISPWAKEAAAKISASEVMVGSDGYFSPKDNVTREMAAVVSIRLYQRFI